MGEEVAQQQHSELLVSMWRDFVDWEKRRVGEHGFLVNQLHAHNVHRMFDVSLGDGCDSIYLLKQGFDVTSNEIDSVFLNKAQENAITEHIKLDITTSDWRSLDTIFPAEQFDAVLCMGNSFTYLFEEADRVKTLQQFHRLLRPGGVLLIDERNYQYMLDEREQILAGNFRYSRTVVYCGDVVQARPVEIHKNHVRMEYHDQRTDARAYLDLYPFKRGELKQLLERAGFVQIQEFSDYNPGFNSTADFYEYVCQRS